MEQGSFPLWCLIDGLRKKADASEGPWMNRLVICSHAVLGLAIVCQEGCVYHHAPPPLRLLFFFLHSRLASSSSDPHLPPSMCQTVASWTRAGEFDAHALSATARLHTLTHSKLWLYMAGCQSLSFRTRPFSLHHSVHHPQSQSRRHHHPFLRTRYH